MSSAALRFFDACAGIGCFHHGMVKAGFTCVGAAELDERLQKEYPKAFGLDPSRMFGNLHEVTETERWKAARDEMHGCLFVPTCSLIARGCSVTGLLGAHLRNRLLRRSWPR